jgi:hypothetical protein
VQVGFSHKGVDAPQIHSLLDELTQRALAITAGSVRRRPTAPAAAGASADDTDAADDADDADAADGVLGITTNRSRPHRDADEARGDLLKHPSLQQHGSSHAGAGSVASCAASDDASAASDASAALADAVLSSDLMVRPVTYRSVVGLLHEFERWHGVLALHEHAQVAGCVAGSRTRDLWVALSLSVAAGWPAAHPEADGSRRASAATSLTASSSAWRSMRRRNSITTTRRSTCCTA